MGKVRVVTSITLFAILLALAGCQSGGGPVSLRGGAPGGGVQAALPDLPAPSVLRQAKTLTSGVFRYGSQYVDTLPNHLVTDYLNLLTYTPTGSSESISDTAYAIYGFDSTGYTTDNAVQLAWKSPGTDYGDLWIGLANFTHDRWDWFPGPAGGALVYDPADYSSANKVYVVLLCMGSEAWQLSSVRISSDVPPTVVSVSPDICTEGAPVAFTATLDGTATSYSWDFGGGATPNTSTAAAPLVTPGAPNSYSATLTVSNANGSDLYHFGFSVQASDTSPVPHLGANPSSGDPPLLVDFDASDSYDPDDGNTPGAGIVLYELDFTDDGTYEYISPSDPTTSYTYTTAGTFTCRLRVTDDDAKTSTRTVEIDTDVPVTYTVSGTVTMADAGGLQYVWMSMTPGSYHASTDADGAFSITGVSNGSYTLTPSGSGWTYSPSSLPVTVGGADVSGLNFVATANPIADLTADPLIGNAPLAVNFDASASFDRDNGGAAGAGIVKYEWDWDNDGTFDFDSSTDATVAHTYTTPDVYTCCVRVTDNESATATDTVSITVGSGSGYIASGYVKTGDTGLGGVTLSFSGGLSAVTTDNTGFWYRDGVPNGTYTVTPSMPLFTFSPLNRQFTINNAAVVVDDFQGTLDLHLTADTLYAIPLQTSVAVGEHVRVLVATGQPPHALQYLSSAGVTVENAGTYVANSYNIGDPGGDRGDTDGYWALMTPPPGDNSYMDPGDAHNPGAATDIGGGLHRYNFLVVPMGSFTPPVSIGDGAVLCNFELSFSAPGTYHLGYQATDGSFDQTLYADQTGTNHYWGTLDHSYTITVN
jgi:PKD repeat protein